MTFDLFLKEPQAAVPPAKQKKTPLVLIVSHRGKKYKKNIGLSVLPHTFVKGKVRNEEMNARLRSVRSYIAIRLSDLSTPEKINDTLSVARSMAITGKDWQTLEAAIVRKDNPTFSEYLEEWVLRGGSSVKQRKLFKTNMEKFIGKNIRWDEVDDSLHFRLEQKMNEAGFSVNYQRKTVGSLKSVMEEGRKLRYHACFDYKDWRVVKEYPDMIYLTKDEVDRIWNLELDSPTEKKARDLFIIGVYTVARYSDYSRVSDDIIHDGMIHFIHQKTATPVVVPVAPRVREVLDRNGGRTPKICQQKFNKAIKEVCKKAGIDDTVEYVRSHGTEKKRELKHKYELVTSHTARRTGATLLRLAGATMREIMLIGGWTSEQTLERYLRMTKEENAEKMKTNPFFT